MKKILFASIIALCPLAVYATNTVDHSPRAQSGEQALERMIQLASLSEKQFLKLYVNAPAHSIEKGWRSANSVLTQLYVKKVFSSRELNALRVLGNKLLNKGPYTYDDKIGIIAILKATKTAQAFVLVDKALLLQLDTYLYQLLQATI